jgi:hypothetical protein
MTRTSCQILLVRKHQQQRVLHFAVLDDAGELGPRFLNPALVVGVDDEDKTLSACVCALASHSRPADVRDMGAQEDVAVLCNAVFYCSAIVQRTCLPGTLLRFPNIPEK